MNNIIGCELIRVFNFFEISRVPDSLAGASCGTFAYFLANAVKAGAFAPSTLSAALPFFISKVENLLLIK